MRRSRIWFTASRFLRRKSRAISAGDGWICEYGNNARVINRVVPKVGTCRESPDGVGWARSQQASALAGGREFREAFGNIANLGGLPEEDSTDTEELSVVDLGDINLDRYGNALSLFE